MWKIKWRCIKLNINEENISTNNTKDSLKEQIVINYLSKIKNPFITLSVSDVSKDLNIGINQAYDLFKQKDFPSLQIGKRKTVTLASYLLWKMNKKESEV